MKWKCLPTFFEVDHRSLSTSKGFAAAVSRLSSYLYSQF